MADGTEDQKGDETSGGDQETPKITQADLDKIRSDAAAEVGRAKKSVEASLKQVEAAQTRTERFIKQSKETELEVSKDQPDALSIIRARHAKEELEDKLATKDTELETAKQTIETLNTQTQQSSREKEAQEVATKFQVDKNDLTQFTDGSKEAMERLAQKLPKKTDLRVDKGGGGGSDSDADFKRDWGSGELLPTKVNMDRARKLAQ